MTGDMENGGQRLIPTETVNLSNTAQNPHSTESPHPLQNPHNIEQSRVVQSANPTYRNVEHLQTLYGTGHSFGNKEVHLEGTGGKVLPTEMDALFLHAQQWRNTNVLNQGNTNAFTDPKLDPNTRISETMNRDPPPSLTYDLKASHAFVQQQETPSDLNHN